MSIKLPKHVDSAIQTAFSELEREAQRSQHTVLDREPFAAEIPEGGILLARISGTSYIYSKVKGVRGRVALTDRP